MAQKIKTGFCVVTLLLAVLAAYVQETNHQQNGGTLVQPAPFTLVQVR